MERSQSPRRGQTSGSICSRYSISMVTAENNQGIFISPSSTRASIIFPISLSTVSPGVIRIEITSPVVPGIIYDWVSRKCTVLQPYYLRFVSRREVGGQVGAIFKVWFLYFCKREHLVSVYSQMLCGLSNETTRKRFIVLLFQNECRIQSSIIVVIMQGDEPEALFTDRQMPPEDAIYRHRPTGIRRQRPGFPMSFLSAAPGREHVFQHSFRAGSHPCKHGNLDGPLRGAAQ